VVAKKNLVATGTTTTYIVFVVSTEAVILICFLDLVILFTSAVLVQTDQHQEGLPFIIDRSENLLMIFVTLSYPKLTCFTRYSVSCSLSHCFLCLSLLMPGFASEPEN
jgi:type III secretory pathway component EscS